MDYGERKVIAEALRITYRHRPTGGTDRERQAWRNGFREALDAIEEAAQPSDGFPFAPWLVRAHEAAEPW